MNFNQLNMLPEDILVNEVLPNLTDGELAQLCQTNIKFRRLCQQESIERRIFNAKVNKYKNMEYGIIKASLNGEEAVVDELLKMPNISNEDKTKALMIALDRNRSVISNLERNLFQR